jgi:SAM-dependent methyltransferase
MRENKYDDPDFFARYSAMPRSTGGLEAAGEWEALRALLPDFSGKRVLDLGCGFGWHCRYAREKGALSAIGVDLSERMLERARADTADPEIEYRLSAIEELHFDDGTFEVVLSSLALHYVDDLAAIVRNIWRWLTRGGAFVFSVEHPIFSALPAQDWHYGAGGEKLHWPVDNYQSEGKRVTRFLDSDVVKYHRTFATWIDTLIDAGFSIVRVEEPAPPAAMIAQRPDMADEVRRPMFLIIAAEKPH